MQKRQTIAAPSAAQAALLAAQEKFKRFQASHTLQFKSEFSGRLLDFGCGAGGFMMAAANAGIDAHGVEVEVARHQQFLHYAKQYAFTQTNRFSLYDGRLLPYDSNSFDGCYSWFVFEHVTDPQVSLREIARVLKPGATLSLYADDTRNAWDGHAARPWPPYLPREFAAAYLEGLGMADRSAFITQSVVYISAPVICDVLTTLGMEIVYANAPPKRDPMLEGLYVTSQAGARALGEKYRTSQIKSPQENLTIFARKK